MNLTTEEQRMLTEFLGECWHDWRQPVGWKQASICHDCNIENLSHVHAIRDQGKDLRYYFDFSDWRTVGRLIEKVVDLDMRGVTIEKDCFGYWSGTIACGDAYGGPFIDGKATNNPQEAICRAVLAWLKEEGR